MTPSSWCGWSTRYDGSHDSWQLISHILSYFWHSNIFIVKLMVPTISRKVLLDHQTYEMGKGLFSDWLNKPYLECGPHNMIYKFIKTSLPLFSWPKLVALFLFFLFIFFYFFSKNSQMLFSPKIFLPISEGIAFYFLIFLGH